MSRYISIYVKTCDLCNQTKLQHRQPLGELHPSETPAEPWDTISVDFIVDVRGTPLDLSSFLFLTPLSLYSYSLFSSATYLLVVFGVTVTVMVTVT
jgi:hypothetical protein